MHLVKISLVVAVVAFSLLACGDKGSSVNGKDSAVAREATRAILNTAESLVELNPRHNKQYFVDRQTQILNECANAPDFSSCYKPKVHALISE